jgi:hypothetical protein
MQSYYGSSPAAKGFEFTQWQGELRLPKGITGAGNGKIPFSGSGHQKEYAFRWTTEVRLTKALKIAWAGNQEYRQSKLGIELVANTTKNVFQESWEYCLRG